MRRVALSVTTDGSGDGFTIGEAVLGVLYAVQLVDGDFADGVDVTITAEQGDLSIPVLVKADFNTDSIFYPRVLQQLGTDGTALTTHTMPLVAGRLKVLIAQGGATKTGSFIFYFQDNV